MNALELADELEKYKGIATRDAATMLRKQAEEIEYWKQMFEKAMKTQESDKHWEKHL